LFKKAPVDKLIEQWRREDAKSNAGAKEIITRRAVLRLILLQLRIKRPTLITELGETYRRLSRTQKKILGLSHDGLDDRIYGRVWESVQSLIRLIDEYPGRRDKVLTRGEFLAVMEARDEADCRMRRERMFILANTLLEGTRQLQPAALRDRSDGNVALDATVLPLYGKRGNPSPENLESGRMSANYDGGWYSRDGDHGAMTHTDAKVINKANPTKKEKGTDASKRIWGIELEIARGTANVGDTAEQFPLLTHAISFHRPGELVGEGLRIAQNLVDRGHKSNLFIVDRAYSNGRYREYTVPIRLLGYKHVFNYKDADLDVKAFDVRGFIQVGGAWYLDSLPNVLRTADKVIVAARAAMKATMFRLKSSQNSDVSIAKAREKAKKDIAAAEQVYAQQQTERAKYRLMPKGVMAPDWSRRYLIPTDAPGYSRWKAKSNSHQGVTVTMKKPEGPEADQPNPGGLKHEQHFPWGSKEWTRANGMRNGVESVNRNLKRSQYEDMADPDKRAVRGNTFTYLVAALATVVEHLRQIISFYKRQLATKTFTAKNKNVPSVFWQSDERPTAVDEEIEPPG
jgi:hypothetical protein